jgi:hypothetical protein
MSQQGNRAPGSVGRRKIVSLDLSIEGEYREPGYVDRRKTENIQGRTQVIDGSEGP